MSKATSPYYPPRAKWYSPLRYHFSGMRRRLWLDRFRLPKGMSVIGMAGTLLVPGLGVYLRSRFWGKPTMIACAALLLIFFAVLGHPLANIAFGLLLSIHVSGITYYGSPWLNSESLGTRILVALLLTFCLSSAIYFPLRNTVQEHWFAPLRTRNGVIVVHKFAHPGIVTRGEMVAYNLAAFDEGNVNAHGGLTFGMVLGVGGDKIEFNKATFAVNGIARARLPHMPDSGEVVVPENEWFIWPDLAITGGHGNVPEATISSTMLQMAIVPQTEFAGKPFARWFGRRQDL